MSAPVAPALPAGLSVDAALDLGWCVGAPDLCGAAPDSPCAPGCPSLAADAEFDLAALLRG